MPQALDDLLDLVLPRRCLGCAARGVGLCARCAGCSTVLRIDHGSLLVWAAAAYGGAVQKAIIRYKERGRRDLVAPLAALLTRAIHGAVIAAQPRDAGAALRPVLVGIPSTRAAAAARGGDHVLRLTRRAGLRGGVAVAPRALLLTRAKQDSAGLSISGRAGNVRGAFRAAGPPPAGCAAVLVDDIVTTGSTLREGRRALREAGWPVLGAAVVAATPRRRAGPTGSHASRGLA